MEYEKDITPGKDTMPGFIIIHLGAGYHSKLKLPKYRILSKKACKLALKLYKEGYLASHIIKEVVSLLEDSNLSNAGYGSNLTNNGDVQCDAGIMESQSGNFSAVGCVEGVKNPIRVAYELLQNQANPQNGLEPPMVLAGYGARQWASERGITVVENGQLVSPEALDTFKRAKKMLKMKTKCPHQQVKVEGNRAVEDNTTSKKRARNEIISSWDEICLDQKKCRNFDNNHRAKKNKCNSRVDYSSGDEPGCYVEDPEIKHSEKFLKEVKEGTPEHLRKWKSVVHKGEDLSINMKTIVQDIDLEINEDNFSEQEKLDTVGAICIDSLGNVCTAVSSGGLIFKQPGRVGQAASFGSGCYVTDKVSSQKHVICACSTSGCGEMLIKTLLAKHCVDTVLTSDDMYETVNDYDDLGSKNHSVLLEEGFLKSKQLKNIDAKLAGCIIIKYTKFHAKGKSLENESDRQKTKSTSYGPGSRSCLDLIVTSTARSFCVGFMSMKERKFKFLLLEMSDLNKVGKAVVTQEFHYEL